MLCVVVKEQIQCVILQILYVILQIRFCMLAPYWANPLESSPENEAKIPGVRLIVVSRL